MTRGKRFHRTLSGLALLATLAASYPLAASQRLTPASQPLGGGADRFALGAARTVGSILAYSRWPVAPDPVRLCVIGSASHAARLDGPLPGGITVSRRDFPASAPDLAAACDALYLGNLPLPVMRAATGAVRGRPVVTIAENDPACRSEAMFCLAVGDAALSFEINIDAISRSTVRIDPRVLRIARGYQDAG
jgi:hypothetical protein